MSVRRFPPYLVSICLALTACGAGIQQAAAETTPATDTPTTSGELPGGAYRLKKAEIVDSQGFGRPMPAATAFIPPDWSASGGVVWQMNNAGCGKAGTHFAWQAVSPDGMSAIEVLPQESWSGNNLPFQSPQNNCPNISITSARDYLSWYVERERSGAQILEYRDRPDLTETLQNLNRTDNNYGLEMRSWVEAGEVLIGYSHNGKDMREAISMLLVFNLSRMPGVMPGEIREFLIISTLPGLAFRAPEGQLDFDFNEIIRKSIRPDPEWTALMAQHNRKMNQIATKGAADRHAIRMKANREIAEINRQSYENTQASIDRGNEEFNQMIRGVDTYTDTTSQEQIELPNTHDHIWRLNDDTYIFTNDANFNPGVDLGLDGRQLEVSQ